MKNFITLIFLVFAIVANSQTVANILKKAGPEGKHMTYKWVNPSQPALAPETQAIIDYATTNGFTLPTDNQPFDQLIKDLKSAGIWQKLDVFYVFAGDGSNGFRLINWINPEEHYADAYGGLTWDLDGVKGNSSNGYINTNFNPTIDAINYVLNEAGRLAVVVEEATGNIGRRDIDGTTDRNGENGMTNTTHTAQRINMGTSTLSGGTVDLSGIGLMTINEVSGTDIMLTNKDIQINRTRSTSSLSSLTQVIFRRTNNYSNLKISCYGMGGALTYAETQSFRTIYNNFLTSIGQTPVA